MKLTKNDNKSELKKNALTITLTAVVIVVLTFFCKAMQYSLIIPLLVMFLGVHLYYFKKANLRLFLNLGLLLTLILGLSYLFITHPDIPKLSVPVAAIGMLTILLFKDLGLAFIMAFISSVLVTFIFHGNMELMLTFFLGSLSGIYVIQEARTRGQIFMAGVFVSFIHVVCLVVTNLKFSLFIDEVFLKEVCYPLLANGIIVALLISSTLKIFEWLFGTLTNFSLLELADFNNPLLKKMMLEAPGTYNHSLVVSNLSEAAADAIGADALLTRVGAYYHDIGKIAKAEYFTENQLVGGNKHDNMEPSMSKLVILNHVKEGVEVAKKYKLNPAIVDFIPQHHGTSLMYFFYSKALEEAEEGEVVSEENYRYPGPKPQIRETAITLLADSVEGATRALDDPNPTNIEETVKKIVNNKFIDGQLDECPLTLKEIDKITETFIRVLSATYHGRIKYPEKKNGNQNKKSSEKASNQKSEDLTADQDGSKASENS
jgi:putative nucleotidyltransferase with HDIG domain